MKNNYNSKNTIPIEELRRIQLNILKKVAAFCEENNITYYLYYGTLLGAVRHAGFIPWDDDIDICMFRKDYDTFFQKFNINRKDDLCAVCCDSDNVSNYYVPIGKVYDKKTVLKEEISTNCVIGVNIDIFALDNVPLSEIRQKMLFCSISFYKKLLFIKNSTYSKKLSLYKNAIIIFLRFLLFPIPIRLLTQKLNKIASLYQFDKSLKVANLQFFLYTYREIVLAEWFGEPIKIVFEGDYFNAPAMYHKILEALYGDYMSLPPKEQQISRHFFNAYYITNKCV